MTFMCKSFFVTLNYIRLNTLFCIEEKSVRPIEKTWISKLKKIKIKNYPARLNRN